MELRHLYTLSETICEKIDSKELPKDILENMEIKVIVPSPTFYGIDKEFYYLTHNRDYGGFVHSEVVNAKINGVKFNIIPEKEENETIEII
jgi:hypothetical protein